MGLSGQKNSAIILEKGCPTECSLYHERKMGQHGPYYHCHKCKYTISEGVRGGIDAPCGNCSICGGLLFWRLLPNGVRFQACWSPNLHPQVLPRSKTKP